MKDWLSPIPQNIHLIWIGTNDMGLCRTDGNDFNFFNIKNGLENNTV